LWAGSPSPARHGIVWRSSSSADSPSSATTVIEIAREGSGRTAALKYPKARRAERTTITSVACGTGTSFPETTLANGCSAIDSNAIVSLITVPNEIVAGSAAATAAIAR
jgi:hypothetical protein